MIGRKAFSAALLCMLGAGCAMAPSQQDLNAYLERREICDHLRGEIPDGGDPVSAEESVQAINAHCKGADAALRSMKRLFARDPKAMARLNELEPEIE